MSEWLKGLNKEQQQACLHNYGPMLILAGAGSGKTTTLVARTGRLIAEKIAKPKEICVLTFTNKSARELKERVEAKLGSTLGSKQSHEKSLKKEQSFKKNDGLWTGTFHSFGLQIIRRHHKLLELPKYFGILDSQDASSIVKEILKGIKFQDKEGFDIQKLYFMISDWRERGQRRAINAEDEYELAVQWLLPKYKLKKKVLGVVDFDDLLILPLEIFKKNAEALLAEQNRFKQVMIDEFQDTNITQMKLVDLLVKNHQNLTVVGDDDQSIYGWRGARVQNIIDFPKRNKNTLVVRLEQNYRSTNNIIELANKVIVENTTRHEKQLIPQGEKGQLPELFIYNTDEDELDGVHRELLHFKTQHNFSYTDMAVLYRSNTQGALLEADLKTKNIPHNVSGGTAFLDRKEVKDALAYLRCIFQPNDVAFRRIFNYPPRGLGDTTVEKLHDYSQKADLSFVKSAFQWRFSGIDDRFGQNIDELHNFLKESKAAFLNPQLGAGAVLLEKLTQVGLKNYIYKSNKEPKTAEMKWRWIEYLARSLDKFMAHNKPTTKNYMEFINFLELKDTGEEEKDKGVSLMTLHACKGLEFPVVIIVGLEEDLLPHKTLGEDVFEERRLFYVGITRAEKHLLMSRCKERKVHGIMKKRTPTRFLNKIPENMYTTFANGFRPVQEEARKALLTDLFSKLDKQSEVETI